MQPEPVRHALIVDEDPAIHTEARAVLSALGYRVRSARTGEEARRLSEESAADLLLTAVILPDMDGLELASRLGANSPRLLVIYMSAASDPVRIIGPVHAGSGSLNKPFAPERLADEIERLVGEQAAMAATTRG